MMEYTRLGFLRILDSGKLKVKIMHILVHKAGINNGKDPPKRGLELTLIWMLTGVRR